MPRTSWATVLRHVQVVSASEGRSAKTRRTKHWAVACKKAEARALILALEKVVIFERHVATCSTCVLAAANATG